MRNWLKTVLFLSAFSPALISVAIARYLDKGWSWDVGYYAIAGIVGASISLKIMSAIRQHGEVVNFSAKKIESNDALMLGVFLSYAAPFVTRAPDITFTVVVAVFCGLALLQWMTSSLPPHPLLRLLSYRFYKVESDGGVVYTLITRRDLRDPKSIKKVLQISSSMLMEAA